MDANSKYIIDENLNIGEALVSLNQLSNDILTLFVVDGQGRMVGSLTDGDIRRCLIKGVTLDAPVSLAMNRNFHYLQYGNISIDEIKTLKSKKIVLLPYLDCDKHIIKIYNLQKQKSILPVDAVLMAGGKGLRLRPLTETVPKPLLKVGNKPIIDYNIDRLIEYGVDHISITVNYLKEQIESYIAESRVNSNIRCIREPQYLGTIGSIRFVEHFHHDTVLVMNSDLFTNINYEDFFSHFSEHQADMSVAAVPYSVSVPYGIFDLEGREIRGIKEKPTFNYYANAGIYLIKKDLLELIPSNTFFDATDFLNLLISKGYKVIRYPITGYWLDIGKFEDFDKAQELVNHL
ncbi:nucleotidyltransferase [Parabacteroides sp. AF48-14]|uniref:nucleotidyltransferase family protein n=1 Tax=Parabacteroides sp. AF48-14 TaxID=2292052 RepID=UPI000EFF7A89|nr:nucleotidyltransferase family protein [Parabacteroides sp. AF48-14]RHO68153.1 nucleotidyltransferase [Parabacteroides sp. AF48-14]